MDKNKQKPKFTGVNFPKLEEEILSYWKENNIFEKSVEKNKGNEFKPRVSSKPMFYNLFYIKPILHLHFFITSVCATFYI